MNQSSQSLKIGLVIADDMEFLPFTDFCTNFKERREGVTRSNEFVTITMEKGDRKIELTGVKCGIGKVNAATAAAFMIASGTHIILNCGLSGGISHVCRGEIIGGSEYLEADFDLSPLGYELGNKPGQEWIYYANPGLMEVLKTVLPDVQTGRLGCGDFFLSDPDRKELYKNKFDLIAFDMETGAIASVCSKSGVPFLSIRLISDDAADCSADEYTRMNNMADTSLVEVIDRMLKEILEKDSFWN